MHTRFLIAFLGPRKLSREKKTLWNQGFQRAISFFRFFANFHLSALCRVLLLCTSRGSEIGFAKKNLQKTKRPREWLSFSFSLLFDILALSPGSVNLLEPLPPLAFPCALDFDFHSPFSLRSFALKGNAINAVRQSVTFSLLKSLDGKDAQKDSTWFSLLSFRGCLIVQILRLTLTAIQIITSPFPIANISVEETDANCGGYFFSQKD